MLNLYPYFRTRQNGNGGIITTNSEGSSTKLYANGLEVNTTLIYGKRSFRECFDWAYDTICDDFIGCVAWYSNPGVALMAAAYCQIHG